MSYERQSRQVLKNGQRGVGKRAHRQHQALPFAIFRHEANPGAHRIRRRVQLDRAPLHPDAAGSLGVQSEQRLRDLGSAGADEAGKPDDLS